MMRRIELVEPGVTAAPIRSISLREYDAKAVVGQAAAVLAGRAGEVLERPRSTLGPPWTSDHRVALAATVVAGSGDRPLDERAGRD